MNDPRPDSDMDALFALARQHRPDTSHAEYAFETRLMAHLRSRHDSPSIWATVSWRLIPFFAVCIVTLTVWQAETSPDVSDAATVVGLTNPVAADLWND
jgi:hypothetical protein